jgi:hypothetical protein
MPIQMRARHLRLNPLPPGRSPQHQERTVLWGKRSQFATMLHRLSQATSLIDPKRIAIASRPRGFLR